MRDDNLESEHEVPDVVLELFDAYVSSDDDTFIVLVNERFAALQAVSDTLARVPAAIRGDPEISEAWAQFAWAAAHLLAERGDRRLLDRITAPADNPMVRWQHAFELADHLREDGRFVESDELLTDLIAELRMCRGTGVDRVLGPALGTAGANAFDRGDLFAALDLLIRRPGFARMRADRRSRRIAIYSDNLATLGDGHSGRSRSDQREPRPRSATPRHRSAGRGARPGSSKTSPPWTRRRRTESNEGIGRRPTACWA